MTQALEVSPREEFNSLLTFIDGAYDMDGSYVRKLSSVSFSFSKNFFFFGMSIEGQEGSIRIPTTRSESLRHFNETVGKFLSAVLKTDWKNKPIRLKFDYVSALANAHSKGYKLRYSAGKFEPMGSVVISLEKEGVVASKTIETSPPLQTALLSIMDKTQ